MSRDSQQSLIFLMAETLAEPQISANTLTKALKILCDAFSFECGLIYELDYSNRFCLKEHYSPVDYPLYQEVSENGLLLKERQALAGSGVFFLESGPHNNPLDSQLLQRHKARSMALGPVIDQNLSLCGFVVLIGFSERACLSSEDQKLLKVLLPLLLHTVSGRMYQNRLAQSRQAFENLFDNTGIDIYVNDFYTHDILYINQSMAAPYGGKQAFTEKKCWQVLFPGQLGPCEFCPSKKLIDDQGFPSQVYSWDYQRAFDGRWFRVFSSAFYWEGGRLAHMVSSADITDNKDNEAMIERLANFDPLTGLPNRRMLLKECEHRIDHATSTEQGYVLFFDIDGFKAINDNLGHDAGDEFLIKLGEFFTSIPLLKNAIYRNGGDEFVAIVGGEGITKDHIQSLTHFIHNRFKKPWKLKKGDIFCNTSVGVACYPEDGTTVEVLLQKADKAMYRVKKAGGGTLCFGYQLDE